MDEVEARRFLQAPLGYPGLATRACARQVLYLWRQPAFDPEASWTLLQDSDDWYVRRVVYACREHLGQLVHDTFGAEGQIARSAAISLVDDLEAISLHPFPRRTFGLDGVVYGVVVGDQMGETSMSWWGEAPHAWMQLRDWFARAVFEFEGCLTPCIIPLQERHPWVE